MSDEPWLPGWQALVGGSLGPIALALWKAYESFRKLGQTDQEKKIAFEEKERSDALAVRASLNAEQTMLWDRNRLEMVRVYGRIDQLEDETRALEYDRDRGWNLARWWRHWAITHCDTPDVPGLEDAYPRKDQTK